MNITEEGIKRAIASMEKMWAENARNQAIRAVENCAIGNTVSLETMLTLFGPWCLTVDDLQIAEKNRPSLFDEWRNDEPPAFQPMKTKMFHVEKLVFREGFLMGWMEEHYKTLWRRIR